MRRSHLFITGRQKLIPILFCGLLACCVKNSPAPLMTCDELAKAKPLTRVHIRATISLTRLLTCNSGSTDSETYCYVPVGCGTDQLFVLLKRGNERNSVYIPFDLGPNKKLTDPDHDLKSMEVRTADGKAAGIGALIDIEGDLKKGKPSGTLQEIVYIENPEIHLVPASSPVASKP